MKNLKTLFNCGLDVIISGVQINSKLVKNGDLFICRRGVNSDAHDFVDEAIENGAIALICERKVNSNVPVIIVDNVNDIIPDIMDWFYGKPNESFKKIIGVTGTAGKTTTCSIIHKILNKYYNSAYFGSLGVKSKSYKKSVFDVPMTTYPITYLYNTIERLKNNTDMIVLETSSEGLKQNRTGNIKFDIAIITNLSKCHMLAHKNMTDYINSKMTLFKNLKEDGIAILNIDDEYYDIFNRTIKCKKFCFGKSAEADLRFDNVEFELSGTRFNIIYEGICYDAYTNLIGEYNVYNICAALSCVLSIGIDIKYAIELLNDVEINGRMNVFKTKNGLNVVADVGLSPVGIKKNLLYLNKIKKGRILTIMGMSGNDSDDEELNTMGLLSSCYSDYVIFTSNRNFINKTKIIEELTKKVNKNNYEIIYDRKTAILKALEMADKNDIVFVSGSESFVVKTNEKPLNIKELVESYDARIRNKKIG